MDTEKITKEEVELIKSAQAGNESAFTRLFNKYKPLVETILFDYLKDWDEARDVTNLVFMKVFEKLSMFTTYDSFGGWLRTIANNTAIDYLRALSRAGVYLGSNEDKVSLNEANYTVGDGVVDHLTYKQILELLNELPELKREICLMYYQDRMTVQGISDTLNVPTGTIKSVLSRARKKIKQQLKI